MRKFLIATLTLGLWSSLSLAQSDETPPPAAPANVVSGAILKGSWHRPDGEYSIQIEDALEDGTLRAGYFNPRPIRVASARWRFGGNTLQIRVDLNDTGYEGAFYILQFNSESGQLEGEYHPASQESFNVVFERRLGPVLN